MFRTGPLYVARMSRVQYSVGMQREEAGVVPADLLEANTRSHLMSTTITVHQLDERFGLGRMTLCNKRVSPRLQVGLASARVTCPLCQQIQVSRDKMDA